MTTDRVDSLNGLTVCRSASGIGAEIGELDLRDPLTDALHQRILRLLGRHKVLFFRGQQLDTGQHVGFARQLGRILRFDSVVPANPQHPEVHDVSGSTVGWHVDASARIDPPVATMLRAVQLPPTGGDTVWADGVAAYDGLPGEWKRRLEGLCAIHTGPEDRRIVAHPVVLVHPQTGRRHLYLNLAPWVDTRILGLPAAESKTLVDKLARHYLRPEHQMRFRWRPGDVVLWDNRVTQHTGTNDYGDAARRMERICIAQFWPAAQATARSAPGVKSLSDG